MRGRTVEVLRKSVSYDEGMDKTETWETEASVGNVLVRWGAEADFSTEDHASGVRADATIALPVGCGLSDLTGRRVRLPEPWGGDYEVVGMARPSTDVDSFGGRWRNPWYWTVRLKAVDG